MPEEILRTFIAIELDETLQRALREVEEKLKQKMPPRSVRWIAPDSIHLTLKFLGDTPRRRLPELEAAMQAACTGISRFEFAVEGRGCFPNTRRPRIVWSAVRDKGQRLTRLQAAVEHHVAPLGWPTEERAFSPHLTLGRVGRGVSTDAEQAVGRAVEMTVVEHIGVQAVDGLSLMQSELLPGGAVYKRLFVVPFDSVDAA